MFEVLSLCLGTLLLAAAAWQHRFWSRVIRPEARAPRAAGYPSLSVIRPVKGLDVELFENARNGLEIDYPGPVETFFVFDDASEPALPTIRLAIDAHLASRPDDRIEILFSGEPPPHRTGKLNAMITGLEKARGELIVFADSDMRWRKDTLRVLADTLIGTPGAGSAFPPVVVSEPPQTAADVCVAMMLNSLYTPLSCLLAKQNGGALPFILGQCMMFRRSTLDELVRLEEVRGQFVDDLHIGTLVERAGLRNIVAAEPIRLIQYGYSAREGVELIVRWMTFARTGMPRWSYRLPTALRAAIFLVALVSGAIAAGHGLWGSAAIHALAALTSIHTMHTLHRGIGGAAARPRHWLAPALLYLTLPVLLAITHFRRSIDWRGRRYELSPAGTLAAELGADRPGQSRGST